MGDESDISSLLKIHRPHIVVDEDGGELPLSLSFDGSWLIFLSGEDCLQGRCTLLPDRHDGFTTR